MAGKAPGTGRMRTGGGLLLALFFFFFPAVSAGTAETVSRAESLLAAVRADWGARKSLSARFTQLQHFAGFDEQLASEGRLEILRPNYFALRFDPPHRQLQICDGRWVWTYMEEQKQVFRAPLSPDATRGADLLEWALAGASAIGMEPDTSLGIPAVRLELRPGGNLPFRDLRIWVREGSHELLGYEASDAEGNQTRLRLLKIEAAGDLKPSDFRFEPPEGVEVIIIGAPE